MEEATEVCAGTIITTTAQIAYTIATSSSNTNLATCKTINPYLWWENIIFPPPRPRTPTVARGPQITVGPPVRNFLLYDKNAEN